MTPTPRPRTAAFSLIEVLIALLLLMVALFAGAALQLQRPRALQRIEAQAKAVRALEGTLEALRSGALPLVSTRVPGPSGIAIEIVVESAELSGLWTVRVEAQYRIRDEILRRELRSLIWRPL